MKSQFLSSFLPETDGSFWETKLQFSHVVLKRAITFALSPLVDVLWLSVSVLTAAEFVASGIPQGD
jgi:hypothetical protein